MKFYKAKDLEKFGITRNITKDLREKGLISSNKDESGDYIYSEEDIKYLKRYKVLRIADLTFKQIKEIEDGKESLVEVLNKQKTNLEGKAKENSNSASFCDLLIKGNIQYEDLLENDTYFKIYVDQRNNGEYFLSDEYGEVSADLTKIYYCPNCGKKMIIDLEDYAEVKVSERPMGQDNYYNIDAEIECENCGCIHRIMGYIEEYPIGDIECEELSVGFEMV